MALDTMYAGKVNSPATTLDGAINDSITTINVVDGGDLPDAPNIAVIGTGEDAETILYGAKNANELSSVTRGFEGTAKAWDSGESIARLFTAYDYNTLKGNITDLDGRLGETNTASNIGEQVEIFKQKDGVDLEFRTLKAGTGIDLTWYEEGAYVLQHSVETEWQAFSFYGDKYYGAAFTPATSFNLRKVAFYLRRYGNPPDDVHIDIYLADENHKPTGSSLANGTILASALTETRVWHEAVLNQILGLDSSTEYCLILKSPSSTSVNRPSLANSNTEGGGQLYSGDSGSTWSYKDSQQILFRLYEIGLVYSDYIEISLDLPNDTTKFLDGDGVWRVLVEADISDFGSYLEVNLTSPAKGDILYYDGDNWVNLGIGSEGQVLKVSSEGIPEWADIEELS